jgi:hypothetical protein
LLFCTILGLCIVARHRVPSICGGSLAICTKGKSPIIPLRYLQGFIGFMKSAVF